MFKAKILTLGKIKESWLLEALSEYEKRLKNALLLEWRLFDCLAFLEEAVLKEERPIVLDMNGKLLTSEVLSQKLYKDWGARPSFVIGGSEGLSEKIIKKAHFLWSLSPLTFTHQMVRLILAEQLYRAIEIEKGSSYHK